MNAYVPYTRNAVQLIRNGASARDLGWADSMYASVCRSHGLAQHQGPGKPVSRHVSSRVPASIEDIVRYRSAGHEVIREDVALALSRVQGIVFALLLDRWRGGTQDFISTSAILTTIGATTSEKAMKENIARLSIRLTPLRMWIESKMGSTGGFRLRVDA